MDPHDTSDTDVVVENVELCAPGVYRLRTLMANAFYVSDDAGGWALIDTGMRGYAGHIRRTARDLFGGTPPTAIVLTHGHFDHVGGLPALAREWGVPVYAHPLEMPYLTGRSSYPPPDPTVGGGIWARLSPLFPRGPIDLGDRVHMLAEDQTVQSLPGWQWIHTPGHTAGHVSLFRESDRTLIAGDAVVTTRQESLTDVVTQREVVWRPPAYFTQDWGAARESVKRLAALEPDVLVTGHGRSMRGDGMRRELRDLAEQFDRVIPKTGRYVRQPAVADQRGTVYVPPQVGATTASIALGVGAALAGAALVAAAQRGRASHHRTAWRSDRFSPPRAH